MKLHLPLLLRASLLAAACPFAAGADDAAFCSDTQHPNAQGNLIIAGNMAQQLGYAGRTAGQLRVAAGDTEVFTHQAADLFSAESTTHANVSLTGDALVLGNGATLSASWGAADELETGFTVDFGLADGLGNGSEGGNTSGNIAVSIDGGSLSTQYLVAHSGARTGDVQVTLNGEFSIPTLPMRTSAPTTTVRPFCTTPSPR